MNNTRKHVKIAVIGAGSGFGPATVTDFLLNKRLEEIDTELWLMDIDKKRLDSIGKFACDLNVKLKRDAIINITTSLDEALEGTDFVIVCVERGRWHYWSMDFHIPRRYGFRQIFGENGGPGGMFHFLRNITQVLNIARRMEVICPNALMINYSNPEAKLVECVGKLTKIEAVGLCHGFALGEIQIAEILGRDKDTFEFDGYGLNHFVWTTSILDKESGEDLYPEFARKEAELRLLKEWDEIGLSRMMFRTYGLWPYPGSNHIGEYFAWSDEYMASPHLQYFFDPVREQPWETGKTPEFVYMLQGDAKNLYARNTLNKDGEMELTFNRLLNGPTKSGEYAIDIIEAVTFDTNLRLAAANLINKGALSGLMMGMCLESPCIANASGVHAVPLKNDLPMAISAMINLQGGIHQLLIEAVAESSRSKLLQAVLLDPSVSTYNNAVALIDEMFERQVEVLPKMCW